MCCIKALCLNESALFDYFFLYQKLALSKHQQFLFPLNRTPWNHFDLFSCNSSDHILLCYEVTVSHNSCTKKCCLSCESKTKRSSLPIQLLSSRSRVRPLLLALLLQAMSFCDYSIDVCLQASTLSNRAATANKMTTTVAITQTVSTKSMMAMPNYDVKPLSKLSNCLAIVTPTPPPLPHPASPPSPYSPSSLVLPTLSNSIDSDNESESDIDCLDETSDDSDNDWVSFDYPELTPEERDEYAQLKANVDWVCICCGGVRSPRNGQLAPKRQVSFDQRPSQVHEIDSGPFTADDYRAARRDSHLSAKFSFQADVQRAERCLSRILTVAHRDKMRRYIQEQWLTLAPN